MTAAPVTAGTARAARVRAVRAADTVNGIDYAEVTSPDQRSLALTFVHPLPGQPGAVPDGLDPLGPANLRITGGVRVPEVRVVSVAAAGRVLNVEVTTPGDFSTYVLALVEGPGSDAPPSGFDPVLSRVAIDFKVGCPRDLDCLGAADGTTPSPKSPPIDYLARDWSSFRRTMLDRMSVTNPDWRERSPADALVTTVEALAFAADRLAYMQDAVATEAYLGTARLRPSLRRHARLLDYRVHDGCNARTWLALEVTPGGAADGAVLRTGTAVAALGAGAPPVVPLDANLPAGAVVFETLHDQPLAAARNDIDLHDWSGAAPRLKVGATGATLRRTAGLVLAVGDILILEERASPVTGRTADADPARRAALRLTEVAATVDPLDGTPLLAVRWHPEDALPFDLVIAASAVVDGVPGVVRTARALGNVVLADHGRSLGGAPSLSPDSPAEGRCYRPRLDRRDLVFSEPFDPAAAAARPAAAMLGQNPRAALPAILLDDGAAHWRPRRDLLGADRFAHEFVVEPDGDRGTFLRFGDDVHGRRPTPGRVFTVSARFGGGVVGNIGADSLTTVITPLAGIESLRNPLAAQGAVAPEAAEEVRRYAPQAFRVQARAVTAEDWTRAAERLPEVGHARADLRWTGSWYTVFITIDRRDGGPVRADAAFTARLMAHLDVYRVAGYDLELRDPVYLPLDIELLVCLAPGYVAGDIRGRLAEVFSAGPLPGGARGFFHPENFTFGVPLYLSQLHAAALAIDGVASVQPVRFHPRGAAPAGEIAAARIAPGEAAILRCDSDPNRPENGAITFDLREAP